MKQRFEPDHFIYLAGTNRKGSDWYEPAGGIRRGHRSDIAPWAR